MIIKISRIINCVFALLLGVIFAWQYQVGALAQSDISFRLAIIGLFFFCLEFLFILISGECSAKGIVIKKSENPLAYNIVLVLAGVLGILSLIGVIHYS